MTNNNLLLAIILSILILAGFQFFYTQPQQQLARQHLLDEQAVLQSKHVDEAPHPSAPLQDRAVVLKNDPRLPIMTPKLQGSINLKGARIDDLSLAQYHESVESGSPLVRLLSPAGSAAPDLAYYTEFSWLADSSIISVPTSESEWKADSNNLTPEHPVKLTWDNGQGLVFERTVAVDNQYMFTLTDIVRNAGPAPVTLYPFGLIARQGNPAPSPSRVIHEGPLGVLNGTLHEYTYKDLMTDFKKSDESKGGWFGITDKYWLIAMVAPEDETLKVDFTYNTAGQTDPTLGYFQTDFRGSAITLAPGTSADHKTMLFAGVKSQDLLEHYKDEYSIPLFDYAIDFGKFWFLTIPFLHLLSFLNKTLGSFALALLVFTVGLKLITLPLSLKSNHSMSRMKALQPEIQRIKERFPDDKMRQSQETMELYKRENVKPLAGCVPTLIQIPIFFALYKVIYVGIEMRQAPFYGWIKDMSVPDPTSIFTLFGTIPWTPPTGLHLGAWPLLMGCSMFLQQRMSPQPPDKNQARMLMFMPVMFMYMLRNMPAGLVIYWTWSNLLSILQQWYIMRQDEKRKARA